MKFLCVPCDEVMEFAERELPGDGTLTAIFHCPACGRETALLTNPMETRLVSSLGVEIGGRAVPEQPFQQIRTQVERPREDAFEPPPIGASSEPTPGGVAWTPAASERLERVPRFVRGMVKRIYAEYAAERSIREITPEVMDRARADLGLEGM